MIKVLKISVVTYQDDAFEVILVNGDGEEVCLQGKQAITPREFDILNDLAPACVWTTYTRESPDGQ